MSERFDTPHLHWQLRVRPGAAAPWSEIAAGLDDLEQSIRTIVLTPPGSVPLEPEKFCAALDYIDRPPAVAIPMISREIFDALVKWEPRIELAEPVRVEMLAPHHFRAVIAWRPRADVLADIIRTEVELAAGGRMAA